MSAYRHIDGHGAEQPDDDIEAGKSAVCRVHVGASELHVPSDQGPAAMCNNGGPEEQSEKGRRYNDGLDKKENS